MLKKSIFGISFIICSNIGLVVGLFFYIPNNPSFRPWTNYFCDVASGFPPNSAVDNDQSP